jgi:hypothetical protein
VLSPGVNECGTRVLILWQGVCAPRRTPRASSRQGQNKSPVRAVHLRRGELRIVVVDERIAQRLAGTSLALEAQAAGRICQIQLESRSVVGTIPKKEDRKE